MLLQKKTIIAYCLETSVDGNEAYGDQNSPTSSPAVGATAINVFEPKVSPLNGEYKDLVLVRGTLGSIHRGLTKSNVSINFKTPLYGNNTAITQAPEWGQLIEMCGMKSNVTSAIDKTYPIQNTALSGATTIILVDDPTLNILVDDIAVHDSIAPGTKVSAYNVTTKTVTLDTALVGKISANDSVTFERGVLSRTVTYPYTFSGNSEKKLFVNSTTNLSVGMAVACTGLNTTITDKSNEDFLIKTVSNCAFDSNISYYSTLTSHEQNLLTDVSNLGTKVITNPSGASGGTYINFKNNTALKGLTRGMKVTGVGVPNYTYISQIINNNVVLTKALTGKTSGSVTFSLDKTVSAIVTDTLTVVNTYGLRPDMLVAGSGIAAGTTISSIDGPNSKITLSTSVTPFNVVAATTGNITLDDAQTIDGVVTEAGNAVLVKNQTATKDNGVYTVVASGPWTRHTSYNTKDELNAALIKVIGGTANTNKMYQCSVGSEALETAAVTFSLYEISFSYPKLKLENITNLLVGTKIENTEKDIAAHIEEINDKIITLTEGVSKYIPKDTKMDFSNKYVVLSANATADIAVGATLSFSNYTSVIYSASSENHKYGTFFAFIDTIKHKCTGVRGNVKFVFNSNDLPYFEFDFKGLYVEPVVDSEVDSYDFSEWGMPYVVNKDNTSVKFNGKLLNASKVEVDLGNQLEYRNYTESKDVLITDRNTTASISWESDTPEWFNFVSEVKIGTLEIVHGVEGKDLFTLKMPQALMSDLDYTEENGVYFFTAKLTATNRDASRQLTIGIDN